MLLYSFSDNLNTAFSETPELGTEIFIKAEVAALPSQ
jgi:hypothetical protein